MCFFFFFSDNIFLVSKNASILSFQLLKDASFLPDGTLFEIWSKFLIILRKYIAFYIFCCC